MRRTVFVLALIALPAHAASVEKPGRYLCTSHEGWEYYEEIHVVRGGREMIYSRGHIDKVLGWETTCFAKAIPILEYCRDLERLDDDAVSEPHDRLRADCLPALGRYTCKFSDRPDMHVTIDRIDGDQLIGKAIGSDDGAESYDCENTGKVHEIADCPNLVQLEPDAISKPHDDLDALCAQEEKAK